MTKNEFEQLIGHKVSCYMYKAIEEAYMSTPDTKEEFVSKYKTHGETYMECLLNLDTMVLGLYQEMENMAKQLETQSEKIECLRRENEYLQGWEPMKESIEEANSYSDLYKDENTVVLTDAQAKSYINAEFGFAHDKITIKRVMPKYEISRLGEVRQYDSYVAHPLMNSSDWNYIAFTCCGQEYIISDGTIKRV